MTARLKSVPNAALDEDARLTQRDTTDAGEVVRALRAAMREKNVDAVQELRWLEPRPPGERDLLSDLAAAVGLETAIGQLARFWRCADVKPERIREIGSQEAEVYERLLLTGESLPIVSLLRREGPAAPWRVVCTKEAYDERFVLWVAVSDAPLDDGSWMRALADRGGQGQLLMDGSSGVLGHPERGWLVHVRGPFVPTAWPPALPGEGGAIIELGSALSSTPEERREQLEWILEAAQVFLAELTGQAAYVPAHDRLILPQALAAAASGTLSPQQALRFWAGLEETDGRIHTGGLGQLGLPEVEASVDLLDSPDLTARLVRWMGAGLVAGNAPTMGTELLVGEREVLVTVGPRGPKRGKSYGRWGALALVPSSVAFSRGSRTRMRVPDDIR